MLQSPTDLDLFPFLYTILFCLYPSGMDARSSMQFDASLKTFHLASPSTLPPSQAPLGIAKVVGDLCASRAGLSELLKSFVYAAYQVGEHPSYNSHSYHLAQTKGLSSSYLTVSCLFSQCSCYNLWLRGGVEI